MSGDEAQDRVDGRSLRRERNVSSVLDAVHDLLVEGQLDPAAEEVAARSGVSLRSIYRYFPDRGQLVLAALGRRLSVIDPLFDLNGLGEGSLEERITSYLDHRFELHTAVAPTIRVAVVVARQLPGVSEVLSDRRVHQTEQLREHFAPELQAMDDELADSALLAVATLCQLESLEALRVDRSLEDGRVRRVLAHAMRALLTSSERVSV